MANRVVQMGAPRRSSGHIKEAADIARNGKLGKVALVRAWAHLDWFAGIGNPLDCEPPAGVDYDMWLGPAPKRPFNPNRFHFNFRRFWDYAGGLMTDWGVHLIDVLLFGMPEEEPISVCSVGGKYVLTDNSETPDTQIAIYEFPTFTLVWEHKAGTGVGLDGRPWGMSWVGSEGTLIVNDAGYEIISEPKKKSLEHVEVKGTGDAGRANHIRNFLDCMKTRAQPTTNLEVGHRVSNIAHLGNIALRSNSKVIWDAKNERILDNKKADKLVGVEYRKPWKLPYSKRA
jgi:predicted dehydrogenase